MSLTNTIVLSICKKGKRDYDPNTPFNYDERRKGEIKQASYFKVPKTLNITDGVGDGYKYKFVSKPTNPKEKVIMYIHGGGFVVGSVESRMSFICYVANKLGYNVAALEYPLAPEHPYPAATDACINYYESLLEQYESKNVCIIGESAGGNLVLSLLLQIKDKGLPIPSVAFALSPCVQYEKVLDSYISNKETEGMVANLSDEVIDTYLRKDVDLLKNPYISPIYGDFAGLCPIHLYASTTELLFDDSVIMHARLQECGVETSLTTRRGMVHTWIVIPAIPEAKKDLNRIKAIIDERFSN